MNCPVCNSVDIEVTSETIDRNTGMKVGVGSFVGGLAMVLIGGFLVVIGISALRDPLPGSGGSPFTVLGVGAILFFTGLPMIIKFFRRKKVELETYACTSCQNRWNRFGGESDSAALDAVLEALKNENQSVRAEAGAVLANVKDSRALEPLIEAVGDEVEEVRAVALRALGGIWDGRAVDAILSALGDDKKSVRAAAAAALGNHRDPRIMEPLIKAMGDKSWTVQGAAGDALKEITGKKFVVQEHAEKWWREKQESAARQG